MQYKVIEQNQDKATGHVVEKKVLYQGPSARQAIEAYGQPLSLPFSHKRFYQGRKRLYAYNLPKGE